MPATPHGLGCGAVSENGWEGETCPDGPGLGGCCFLLSHCPPGDDAPYKDAVLYYGLPSVKRAKTTGRRAGEMPSLNLPFST